MADRTPLDISDFITVNLPEWAFRPTGAAANATGFRYRADVLLTASHAAFGGKHRRLLFNGVARALSGLRTHKRHTPGDANSLVDLQPVAGLVADGTSPEVQPTAGRCSTNNRPYQGCPAGWDAVNKMLVTPAPITPVAAAASGVGSQHRQRKGPRVVPGTVSSLTSSLLSSGEVSVMSVGSGSASNGTSAFCVGSGLVRPVGIEFGIVKPFNSEVDDSGAFWKYHAGIDFTVSAGADVSHDGTVAAAGTDSSLGDYVVSCDDGSLWFCGLI
jgi:hypothetical protein